MRTRTSFLVNTIVFVVLCCFVTTSPDIKADCKYIRDGSYISTYNYIRTYDNNLVPVTCVMLGLLIILCTIAIRANCVYVRHEHT